MYQKTKQLLIKLQEESPETTNPKYYLVYSKDIPEIIKCELECILEDAKCRPLDLHEIVQNAKHEWELQQQKL